MLKVDKYIFGRISGAFLLICGSLTGIVWLTQSLRFIDMIINQGISLFTFLYISALLIPSLLWVIIPVSLFISIIFCYNKLVTESEFVAIENSGLSRIRIALPAIIFAFMVTGVSYFISFYLLPVSYRQFKDMQNFIRDNYASLLLQERVFNTPIKGMTIYIRERTDAGLFKGLLVHDNRNAEKPVTMMAESGRLEQTEAGPRFLLIKGNRQEINYRQNQVYLLNFDDYTVDISTFEKAVSERWLEPEERFLPELLNPDEATKPELVNKLKANGHYRLSWPLLNLALGLLAAAVTVPAQFSRRNTYGEIVIGSIYALVLMIAATATNNIIAKTISLWPLTYLNVSVGILIAVIILARKNSLLKPIKNSNKFQS